MSCLDRTAGSILSQDEMLIIKEKLKHKDYFYLKSLNDIGQYSSSILNSYMDDGSFLDSALGLLGEPGTKKSIIDIQKKEDIKEDTSLDEVWFDLIELKEEVLSEMQLNKENGEIPTFNALKNIANSLDRLSNEGSASAKGVINKAKAYDNLKSELAEKQTVIATQIERIEQLEKDQAPLRSASTISLSPQQQAVLHLLEGNSSQQAPELTACLHFWYDLKKKKKDDRTVNGYESEAKKFLINNHPNVDVSAEKPRIATRFGAMVNPDEQNKKKFKINTVAT
jgi:hypothetical protein